MMLDQSNDPRHPRNFTHWHRVPRCLIPFCKAAATLAVTGETHRVYIFGEPAQAAILYNLMFFRLAETSGGRWFFRAL